MDFIAQGGQELLQLAPVLAQDPVVNASFFINASRLHWLRPVKDVEDTEVSEL
jgi:hypothetical protein